MANPTVLSNVGTTRILGPSQTAGDAYEIIVGQHVWIATAVVAGSTLYLEHQIVEESGRLWVPLFSMEAGDLINKSGLISGSSSVDLPSGLYRATATAAGAVSYLSRLGLPFP